MKLTLRKFMDYARYTPFCKKGTHSSLIYKIHLEQPILPSASFEEKLYNLKYAAEKVEEYIILPKEVFSFWEIVGNPNKLKGSRCIRNNKVTIEKGGGLCQIASVLYNLALIGGLYIVERYHHSIDLYGDGPRACPLGLDATVSYGYKDLRIQNTTNAVLHFYIYIKDNKLCGELQSNIPLVERKIEILKEVHSDYIHSKTMYAGSGELIADNIYKKLS
ncbi:MAG: VanW family protein [Bacteroidaceae bacterium]|nr:VanW family protein [Bacteroidaceae bacterium]